MNSSLTHNSKEAKIRPSWLVYEMSYWKESVENWYEEKKNKGEKEKLEKGEESTGEGRVTGAHYLLCDSFCN